MGWIDNERSVRVDFFKPSGKWYTTEAVLWTGSYNTGLVMDEFAKSLRDHLSQCPERLFGLDAICLTPFHVNAHPVCIRAGGWKKDS